MPILIAWSWETTDLSISDGEGSVWAQIGPIAVVKIKGGLSFLEVMSALALGILRLSEFIQYDGKKGRLERLECAGEEMVERYERLKDFYDTKGDKND
jgi:hypothetical protein